MVSTVLEPAVRFGMEHFITPSRRKLPYSKPTLTKETRMRFPTKIIEGYVGHDRMCCQCSSCHACR